MFCICFQHRTKPLDDVIVQDEFLLSLKMSTYLVAVVVGNLENISKEANGTLVCLTFRS